MYLEISPRRTGKTTRLIEHLKNNKLEKVAIVAPTKSQLYYIFRAISDNKLDPFDYYYFNNITVLEVSLIQFFYVDEYDFVDNLPILNNAYYTGTPGGYNTYPLLKANNYLCHSYRPEYKKVMECIWLDNKPVPIIDSDYIIEESD